MSGLPAAIAPLMRRAPDGDIITDVYDAEPAPLAFSTAETVSVVSPRTLIVIDPDGCPR